MILAEQLHSEPSGAAIRAMAEVTRETRSLTKGLRILAVHFVLYAATLAGAIAPLPTGVSLFCAIANGFLIGLLFIIGHDCGHNSFVPGTTWNRWLGRIAFVPSAHSLSLWRLFHNERHHARTNLKAFDDVWTPMSPGDYSRAPWWRRALERIYRCPAGPILYYYKEFWPHHVLLPLATEVRHDWKRHLPDSSFAVAGLMFTVIAIAVAGKIVSPQSSLLHVLLFGWAIPFALWNYLMALTVYVNHTHPAIPWFDDEESWSKCRSLAPHTASVEMPVNIAPLWTNLLLHTSHHVQTGIPVYAMPEAEKALKPGYAHMLEYRFTPRAYFQICRICKLFDYQAMCWTDFSGRPTTPRLIPRSA
ncbi:MAG TPA: fatty acid desaturase [Micropepsaceae bacterium]|nr:fatty acid desaturase [Micropepsaceae bacterium]